MTVPNLAAVHRFLILLVLATGLANGQIYKWTDDSGNLHFGDEPPEHQQSKPVAIEPNVIHFEPLSVPKAKPQASETTRKPLVKQPTPARLSKTDGKADERICWLRYGISCKQLWMWKSREYNACKQRRDTNCDSPIELLQRRPASILTRDLDFPFPRSGEINTRDLACLTRSGFYCNELKNNPTCIEQYGHDCLKLSTWAEKATKLRCPGAEPENCALSRVTADRPRSFAERNFLKTGRDVILFDKLKIRRDDPEHWPKAKALLQRYPGK